MQRNIIVSQEHFSCQQNWHFLDILALLFINIFISLFLYFCFPNSSSELLYAQRWFLNKPCAHNWKAHPALPCPHKQTCGKAAAQTWKQHLYWNRMAITCELVNHIYLNVKKYGEAKGGLDKFLQSLWKKIKNHFKLTNASFVAQGLLELCILAVWLHL